VKVDLVVSEDRLAFTLANTGRLGVHLQARSNNVAGAPFSYTLGAGRILTPTLEAHGRFDVGFHGPNGFFRRFAGTTKEPLLEVHGHREDGRFLLRLHNRSEHALKVHVADA
jgi:phospholipase C